jgi:hypothetical protein
MSYISWIYTHLPVKAAIARDIVGHVKTQKIGKVGMNGCEVGHAVAKNWIRIAPHTVISIL